MRVDWRNRLSKGEGCGKMQWLPIRQKRKRSARKCITDSDAIFNSTASYTFKVKNTDKDPANR